MGSTFQALTVRHALRQLRVKIHTTDNPALDIFHLQKIRSSFAEADKHPDAYYFGKAHAAFPKQVQAVLSAKHLRVFLIWRDQQDALVSDYHFSRRRAGHVYRDFDDYFARRGRKILLRNCLQKTVWDSVDDDRVKVWDYLDLANDFQKTAADMLSFGGIDGVNLKALERSVSLVQLRKRYRDDQGTFFRQGGKQDIQALGPGPETMAAIDEIIRETDWRKLGADFEREDWMRIAVCGRESEDAGLRKGFHWWLFKTQNAQYLRRNVLPKLYKLSPRRLFGGAEK